MTNRYPLWAYISIAILLVLAALYALPNIFGEQPAVQISSAKATAPVDETLLGKVNALIEEHQLPYVSSSIDDESIRIRVENPSTQLQIKDLLETALNPDSNSPNYIVAVNLISASPHWLNALMAKPMYLGLDLRGGVHFLLQVDTEAGLNQRLDSIVSDIRASLQQRRIRYTNIRRVNNRLTMSFANAEHLENGLKFLNSRYGDMTVTRQPGSETTLIATYGEGALAQIAETAVKQNILTLSNRVNELGVSEPIVQQQGNDRIVVQLPGIQDTALAKDIIGRTATLEIRMVDESIDIVRLQTGDIPVPADVDVFPGYIPEINANGLIPVQKEVILTGDRIIDANAAPGRNGGGEILLSLDETGARIFRDVTRNNIDKRMAIILFEKGQGEVVTWPVIRSEIPTGNVSITGSMTYKEAENQALLLRSGSLAAPMEIIEEKTVGPSLGAENIRMGVQATLVGFAIIAVFMIFYYHLFGVFSVLALVANLLLLVAILSLLQATLTLQGIAAIALTLGIAIDSNVLINERIREELRNGLSPQMAISEGYARAFDTILDSNVTTFIAGLALFIFGTGPIRSFAIVHCLGIITSMFSSIVISRALVNLVYGSRRQLKHISIGQVWKPTLTANEG